MALLIALLSFSLLSLALRAAWTTVSYYYLTPRRIRIAMAKQGILGPEPRFLRGNLTDVASLVGMSTASDMLAIDHDIVGRLFPHYILWSKLYGKRFLYWYGSEPRLCLTEPELIKELLSSKYAQITGRSWLQRQGSKHLIGEGVLMANGSDWFHQRHIVAPAFMGDKLKGHMGYMVECTKGAIKSLHAIVEAGSSEVEIGEYLTRLTGDIISRTEFDSSYDKGKKIFDHLTRLQSLTAQSSRHLWIPGSRFFPSKYHREIKSLKVEIERLMMEIIQSRQDGVDIGRSSSYGKGLLGMLLAETLNKRDDDFSYTLELVMDECKTIFFAGHETTALLLTWTIMLLATNPAWQEKARVEVEQVCCGGSPSVEHLSNLRVLNMIINESLRLYPPVSILPRIAFEDIKLRDLHIPKGLSIWIPVAAIHHSEEIWGKDAHEFNPERFATRSFAMTRNFLPFASGPRNCVGQGYALMEAKIILAMLLTNFNFTISENYRHAPVNVLTLRPKHGVQVYVKPLKSLSMG